MDQDDLIALQEPLLLGQGDLDFRMLVVDNFHRGLYGRLAALAGGGYRAGERKDGADLDHLFRSQN